MTGNDNESASVRTQARAWMIKLRGEAPAGQNLADFEQWRSASPDHAAAFDREMADYRATTLIKSSQEFGSDGNWRHGPARRWLKIGAMAAAVGAVLIAVFSSTASYWRPPQANPLSYAFQPLTTQRGEIRVFRLIDGSVATLDTNSKVEVSITDSQRLLRLAQGRARFEIAAGVQPFTVRAGAGEVVTNAASFDLALDDGNRVTVHLLAGNALIRPQPQFASVETKAEDLSPMVPFAYEADDFEKLESIDLQTESNREWPSGWVAYETIRLDNLIAQANRYAEKPIRLADPMLGTLKVSGRFRISDSHGFVARICALFDLQAVPEQDAVYLRK